jgi:hypothetical protein
VNATAPGIEYYADPWDGGRGVYFGAPDGHNMELLTRP